MIPLSTWLHAVFLVAGGAAGYMLADYLGEDCRTEVSALRSDQRLAAQAAAYSSKLRAQAANDARADVDRLLDRLDRARAARETIYETRTKFIERIPRDRICFDSDDLRVLDEASTFGKGAFADSLDTGPAVDRAAAAAAPGAGLSAGAAAGWITDARDRHDVAREQIGAIGGVLRELDGRCGCIRIDDGRER